MFLNLWHVWVGWYRDAYTSAQIPAGPVRPLHPSFQPFNQTSAEIAPFAVCIVSGTPMPLLF